MSDEVLNKALIFAVNAHAGMKRKGTNTPYIVHPMEAVAIVASMTDDREIIAAAALHDVAEDTKYTIDDIKNEFGDKVARLVASESEDKRPELPESETWKIRKEETLEHLKNASIETKMITLGDKLSNIRAIYRDYRNLGDKLWERFNVKDKNEHAWYYSSIADLLSDLKEYPAWKEYKELVDKVFN
ncbi:HD domain-containing protein [Candidatus Saccharibacteria bacterium]|nr:HD domain-containing protein [Candidatus Saccharibacteria bacterium]